MGEDTTIALRHVIWTTDGVIHFPNGTARVYGGVVRLSPKDRDWVTKAWYDGYRIDDKTGEPINSVSGFLDSLE